MRSDRRRAWLHAATAHESPARRLQVLDVMQSAAAYELRFRPPLFDDVLMAVASLRAGLADPCRSDTLLCTVTP